MPTYYCNGQLRWNYRSAVKYLRKTRQRIEGKYWLVVDREYVRFEKVFKYKLIAAA